MLVQDNDVPFVNTIADVSRSIDGQLKETVLDATMPGYLGAGSEFIFSKESDQLMEGILSGSSIGGSYTDVGYIYGGIRSSLSNIFWINNGNQSEASSTIYKVAIRKRNTSNTEELNGVAEKVLFYPNPAQKFVKMSIEMENAESIQVDIYNIEGVQIHSHKIPKSEVHIGHNLFVLDKVDIGYGAFVYKVSFEGNTVTRKVVWTE
jgi:hypothetical protein